MGHEEPGATKGVVILARLAFVDELGAKGRDAVMAALSPADRAILDDMVLPSSWYPFDLYERLDAAISRVVGSGDDLFRRLGEHSAAHNLGAAHRGYVRDRDPHGLLRQAPSIYRLYYDTGERSYERVSDTQALLRTVGSRTYSRTDCLTVVGWHTKAITMCGGRNVRVTEPLCRARGGSACEYVCEWE